MSITGPRTSLACCRMRWAVDDMSLVQEDAYMCMPSTAPCASGAAPGCWKRRVWKALRPHSLRRVRVKNQGPAAVGRDTMT